MQYKVNESKARVKSFKAVRRYKVAILFGPFGLFTHGRHIKGGMVW